MAQPTDFKVVYTSMLSPKFDKKIIKAMKKFGYEWWASGTDMRSWERDLSFTKKKK